MSTQDITRTRAWVMAARPQTLPAAAAPVIVGTGLAVHEAVFAPLPALAALIGALLIQIGTNFANDYYDALHGADTPDREGFTRVTSGGLIAAPSVKKAMYVTFLAAVLVGTYLVYIGGLPILLIGLLSVAAGIAYTGGPYPLGYHGLGDIFVFVFFGLVAVTGSYYVQATAVIASPFPVWIPPETVSIAVIIASIPVACLSTSILVVNNLRDRAEDTQTGKRTLAVRFGPKFARVEFASLLFGAYVTPLWILQYPQFSLSVLLPYLTLPFGVMATQTVFRADSGEILNTTLERVGKLLTAYAVLAGLGFVFTELPW
jgi:1,4-dihydroxy-2-naphthoate octaprenyltransferase